MFCISIICIITLAILGYHQSVDKSFLYKLVLGGLFYATAVIFNIIMFSKGIPILLGNPIVGGGTILVATVLGFALLYKPLSILKITGIIFIVIVIFIAGKG